MPISKAGIKKYVKKQGKRLLNAGKKRYFGGGKVSLQNLQVKQIASDVNRLKQLVNAEKKRVDYTIGLNSVGQFRCNVAGTNLDTGYYFADITPVISVGTGVTERNGASVKLHSAQMRMQITHQANTGQPTRVKLYIFLVKGQPVTISATEANKILDIDSATGFTCYSSIRNQDNFRNYKLVCQRTLYCKEDNFSGQTITKDYSINLKLGHHLHYGANTNTLRSGQLVMLLVSDNGNVGSATASGGFLFATPPVLGATTGVNFYHTMRYYYYDN